MPRYLIHLAYDGTRYCGWQKQPDAETVQGVLERALGTLSQEEVRLYGSGRTDTGVHAEDQYAHFDTHIPLDEASVPWRLHRMLPDDIQVHSVREVSEHFHARFDASWRSYRYQLLLKPDPFLRKYAWYPGAGLDWQVMQECLTLLEGEHDFSGFSRKNEELPHYRCTIYHAGMEWQDRHMVLIQIRANRFLRSMIRGIVGGMVQTGRGKYSLNRFNALLHRTKTPDHLSLAPPHGLFLEKVFYPKPVLDLT